jgi:hypothetical protein
MSPQQFVETFGPALQDYLEQSYGKDSDTHVCDMLAHTGAFFDATYHSIGAFLYKVDYTKVTTPKGRASSKE